MKKLLYLFLMLFLISCGSSTSDNKSTNISSDTSNKTSTMKMSAQSIISEMKKGDYKEGELLVKFKPGVVRASSLDAHQRVGTAVIKNYNVVPNLQLVKLPEGMSVEDAIEHYMSDPNVEYAEPNYIWNMNTKIPNDQYFSNQWALYNTGTYAGGTVDADIRAPWAWEVTTGNPDLIVAVLDSGIDYNHEDLVDNIWINTDETDCNNGIDDDENFFKDDCIGWDFVNEDNDPMDDNEHGTHVAGIIGARGNNGIGVAGVMWNVKIMPLKIANSVGALDTNDVVAGIEYAVNNGAKIVNASFGDVTYSSSVYNAISYLNTWGVLFVASAGNDSSNNDLSPHYPSGYDLPNIIAVAATDQDDRRTPFSNYGLNSVDVAAPGEYILSTVLGSQYLSSEYLNKDFYFGTSMAAPHVSGLAALLMSHYDGVNNAKFTHHQVHGTILRYVDKKDTLEGWIKTGGRINAYRAVTSLLKPTDLTATAAESITPSSITLAWTDNATGEDGYIVERKDAADFYEIKKLPPGTESFTDSPLAPNTTYTYRVKAYNDIPAESAPSNEASAKTAKKDKNGGGGGCSIGGSQTAPTAIANLAIMLLPLLSLALLRRRK